MPLARRTGMCALRPLPKGTFSSLASRRNRMNLQTDSGRGGAVRTRSETMSRAVHFGRVSVLVIVAILSASCAMAPAGPPAPVSAGEWSPAEKFVLDPGVGIVVLPEGDLLPWDVRHLPHHVTRKLGRALSPRCPRPHTVRDRRLLRCYLQGESAVRCGPPTRSRHQVLGGAPGSDQPRGRFATYSVARSTLTFTAAISASSAASIVKSIEEISTGASASSRTSLSLLSTARASSL